MTQHSSASSSGDERELQRLRAAQRCEALVHSRTWNHRCGRRASVQSGEAWYCKQHAKVTR
jgi:hypothetical protein